MPKQKLSDKFACAVCNKWRIRVEKDWVDVDITENLIKLFWHYQLMKIIKANGWDVEKFVNWLDIPEKRKTLLLSK